MDTPNRYKVFSVMNLGDKPWGLYRNNDLIGSFYTMQEALDAIPKDQNGKVLPYEETVYGSND